MKVCFFGLGSIGRRHLINFKRVASELALKTQIHAYRTSRNAIDTAVAALIDKQIYEESELGVYDIVFVTNPTSEHYNTIKLCASKTEDMFIEKPVFHEHVKDLTKLGIKPDSIYYVAAPVRFNPVVEYIKSEVVHSDVVSVRSLCSSYLPDWRPSVDYRHNYGALKRLGGGVTLDLIHEIDYLTFLFGFPNRVFNLHGKFSKLEIDTDDLSTYLLEYNERIVEIHLDYFGRMPRRNIELYTNDDVIIGDLLTRKINYLNSGREVGLADHEDPFVKEMAYFLRCVVDGKKTINELSDANELLSYALNASR